MILNLTWQLYMYQILQTLSKSKDLYELDSERGLTKVG